MNIKILKSDKNEIEVELDNLTTAEILRAYLHKDSSVEFAAWRSGHPNKLVILRVETKGKSAKKAIEDAVSRIMKEADKLVSDVKKL